MALDQVQVLRMRCVGDVVVLAGKVCHYHVIPVAFPQACIRSMGECGDERQVGQRIEPLEQFTQCRNMTTFPDRRDGKVTRFNPACLNRTDRNTCDRKSRSQNSLPSPKIVPIEHGLSFVGRDRFEHRFTVFHDRLQVLVKHQLALVVRMIEIDLAQTNTRITNEH
jgi:hypothetical protein